MHTVCLSLLALLAQGVPPQGQPAQPEPKLEDLASIEGKVINRLTREPVKFVEITLRLGDFSPETVKTNSEGTFFADQLRPGRYMIEARKNGFTAPRRKPGQGPEYVVLEKAAKKTGHLIELLPQASVSGRITDENGEPVASAMVGAEPARQSQVPGMMRNVQSVISNDRGEYRLFGLQPGRFRIRVTPSQQFQFDQGARAGAKPARIRPEGSPPAEGPVPVYFPSATSAEQAAVVELAAGDERQGIDIQMVKARVYEVSGRVIPPASWTADAVGKSVRTMGSVMLFSARGNMFTSVGGTGSIDPTGRFSLKNVAPGSYNLMANLANARTQGHLKVEVLQSDVNNLEVQFHSPVTVSGVLKTPDKVEPSRFRVMLSGVNMFAGSIQGTVDAKGAFKLENVAPELMTLRVMSSEASAFVQSVRLDGQDVDMDGFQVRPVDGSQLEIVIANNGGTIDGVVKAANDTEHESATIVLWPSVELTAPIKPSLVRMGRSAAQGKFQLQGIRPGRYLLAAFDSGIVTSPTGMPDEEILRSARSKAQSVTIDAGSKVTQDLKSLGDPE
jgi:protocatechuate 3,4-dioxygenase beta subunit